MTRHWQAGRGASSCVAACREAQFEVRRRADGSADGNDARALLSHMVEFGLSGIELMNGPVEAWARAPVGHGLGRDPACNESPPIARHWLRHTEEDCLETLEGTWTYQLETTDGW
jgi:hypothetical protein